MPFAEFPWFRGATIEQLLDVEQSVRSIRDPAAFSLVAREPPHRRRTVGERPEA